MTHDAMTAPLVAAETPLLPGEPGQVSLAEARAYDPQPTWNRHAPESWDMIKREYQAGATAKQLAVKWRMSPTSIYRHAYQEGWSKKAQARRVGEAAQARAAEAEADEIARLLARPEPAREPALEDEADTPDAIRQLALGAVARCLRRGLYADAERMGRLAECLSRICAAQVRLPPPEESHPEWDDTPMDEAELEALRAKITTRFEDVRESLAEAGILEDVIALGEGRPVGSSAESRPS